jgi:AcrR family transcriptional regulator
MQNVVPTEQVGPVERVGPVELAVTERSLRNRAATYADEVRRLIDAAYAVMRDTGAIDPRVSDIVAAAGLSNQAFYRHFRGKDELLLAVLDDGQHRLVDTLERRMRRAQPGAPRIAAWIEAILDQARNPEAAANTRPFAINGPRLADRFPDETARQREQLVVPLREALREAGADMRDAETIYHLAMDRMQDAVVRREIPTRDDVRRVTDFALRALGARV